MNQINEEMHKQYIEKFGENDAIIIQNITYKVANLALRWRIFLYLFCGPPERVDALNAASDMMTKMLRDLLWDDALMRVRQLIDPHRQRKDYNLSLEHLSLIAHTNSIDISERYRETKEICDAAKLYVDKHIAHIDYNHAVGEGETKVTRGQTTDAIRAIFQFVQVFHTKVRGVNYELMPYTFPDDETQFLLRIYQGVQSEKFLEAEARANFLAQGWQQAGTSAGYSRPDIPPWIYEKRKTDDLF